MRGFIATSAKSSTLHEKILDPHTKIKFRYEGLDEKGKPTHQWYETTPGRALLGQGAPRGSKMITFDTVNKLHRAKSPE